MFRTSSDDEYLAQLRRQYESRRVVGFLLIVVGVAAALGAIWSYDFAMSKAMEFLDAVSDTPTSQEKLARTVDQAMFSIGFKVGSAVTGMAAGAGSMLGYGIYLIWGQRKERMLLELTKKMTEQRYGTVA